MDRLQKYKNVIGAVMKDDLRQYGNLLDLFQCLYDLKNEIGFKDRAVQKYAMKVSKYGHEMCDYMLTESTDGANFFELYWQFLLLEAPYLFESYMLYMEKNRSPEKKFYEPRRKTLQTPANDLQRLEDGDWIYYGLSLPSRVGKSTLCIFFMSWIMGKRPGSHNAMGGHSGILAKGFYEELLNLIETPEYTYAEIFPELLSYGHKGVVQKKSADQFTINLGAPDRFSTMTCRGIDGTWTGAIDVSNDGYLYVDDIVRDREHSLSPTRMENTYQEYLNKMVDRMNDGARQLNVGTLWSVLDPMERTRIKYQDDPRYFFRRIPALDEVTDESNFDYEVNGFSTQYYREMRDRLDNAEWMAKFMQKPYVREGLVFPPDELHYYNGVLPEGDYRIVSVVDVAWGGGDSTSMPIGREYESGDVYVFDWVFNRGAKEVTIPLVVGRIMANEIRQIRFEANNGGELYCQYVDDRLREKKYNCSCTYKKAPSRMAKMEKIIMYSGDIKRKFHFLAPGYRTAEYQAAMDELCMTVMVGANEHDDAADSLAMFAEFVSNGASKPAVVVNSPF